MIRFTEKQKEVYECYLKENPKILITSGAKRAGKTFLMLFLFLDHINQYKDQGLSFILGGVNHSTLRRNVLNDLDLILGKEVKLDQSRAFEVFGNKVYCFDGSTSDSWKKVRGFTAAGAFLNEGTALHDTFIKEVISRCSYAGARIFIDTNPENPMHSVKTDYIDKSGQRLSNGQLNIKAFHFSLFDNDTLNNEYIESIIASTPSGMFTDRDIYGKWVSAEGVVYRDFNHQEHYVDESKFEYVRYFAGVDWGYEHYGGVVVIGESIDGDYVLIKEIAEQHKEIDYWSEVCQDIKSTYGNIIFWCDSARPEHIVRLKRDGIRAMNADKKVLSGIEEVSKLFKTRRLFISDKVKRFKEEINMYVWNERTGEPIKLYDDVLDSLRYAVYSESRKNKIRSIDKNALGFRR